MTCAMVSATAGSRTRRARAARRRPSRRPCAAAPTARAAASISSRASGGEPGRGLVGPVRRRVDVVRVERLLERAQRVRRPADQSSAMSRGACSAQLLVVVEGVEDRAGVVGGGDVAEVGLVLLDRLAVVGLRVARAAGHRQAGPGGPPGRGASRPQASHGVVAAPGGVAQRAHVGPGPQHVARGAGERPPGGAPEDARQVVDRAALGAEARHEQRAVDVEVLLGVADRGADDRAEGPDRLGPGVGGAQVASTVPATVPSPVRACWTSGPSLLEVRASTKRPPPWRRQASTIGSSEPKPR